ncbi:MAG: hypothetical protein JRG91_02060 [Deltaproteobacteria bacterium]|nr:hypothetical protein [Deltaproteobacteria bacterium]
MTRTVTAAALMASVLHASCGPATGPGPEAPQTPKPRSSSAALVDHAEAAAGGSRATVPVGPVLLLMTPKELWHYYKEETEVDVVERVVTINAVPVGLDLVEAGPETASSLIAQHPAAAPAIRIDWDTLCNTLVLDALNDTTSDRFSIVVTGGEPTVLHIGDCLRALETDQLHLKLEQATDETLAHLAGLRGLCGLDLAQTSITDVGMEHLSGLKDLRVLDLYDTDVSDAGLSRIAGLTNLEKLVLWSTRITDIGLSHLRHLDSLRVLDLGAMDLTDAGMEHLSGLTELRVLDLWLTEVSDEGLEHLADLENLRVLDLGWANITDAGLYTIAGFGNLRALDLGLANVTDEGLWYLRELTELRVLDLDLTSVTDAGLANLTDMKNLRELSLLETDVTEIGTAALAKFLPGVQINLYHEE